MDPAEQRQNLDRFSELVLADRVLHEQLRAAPDVETFAALAVKMGQERGCVFAEEVVRRALNEHRRAWLERWVE